MNLAFHLVYPQRRTVTGDWIVRAYKDACADGKISDEFMDLEMPMVFEMAMALEDAGIITVGAKPFTNAARRAK